MPGRTRWMVVGFLVVVAAVPLACGDSDDSGTGTTSTRKGSASSSSTRSSTTSAPPTTPTTVLTGWQDATAEMKALAPNPFAMRPEQVAEELAGLLRTSRGHTVLVTSVASGEPAVVVLSEPDVQDDAVAAVDWRVTLEPGDEGWVVAQAEQRFSCRRGVSGTLCV